MWYKFLAIFLIFVVLALTQASFLTELSIHGAVPNLVFILFFLIIFFASRRQISFEDFFWIIIAGFLLDIFTLSYLGFSIIFLLIITVALKWIVGSLSDREDKFPIVYFIPLFILALVFYALCFNLSVDFFNSFAVKFSITWQSLIFIIYNLIFAVAGFYILKKLKFKNEI